MAYHESALSEAVLETIRANKLEACYIRPIVLRGYGHLGIDPAGIPIDTYIAVWEWDSYLGQEALETGVDVCVSTWSRSAANSSPATAKAAGPLSEFTAHQDRSRNKRVRRGHRPGHRRFCERRQR